ncbi:GNAT family N-acetyltransferase [Aliarcobacter butzleri]|uniref:GNAT family N-acetyltransferase n=1 Tax=Aliarcobacter butzleri TaxID=28197 RepID=UPI0024DE68B5|nr:GNAT family N-acetyltransferase [Aliarcobacter butzleri]MDK2050870.1 GNAT family N-acetyltransferase [Aliarcobacter butzleri]
MITKLKEFINQDENIKNKISGILEKCDSTDKIEEYYNSFIIEKNNTYLIFKKCCSNNDNVYFIDAIYTEENYRRKGYATKLLSSLDSNSLYIFDSFSQELFGLLKKLGAREYKYFNGSESRKQYIFSVYKNYDFIPTKEDLDLLN